MMHAEMAAASVTIKSAVMHATVITGSIAYVTHAPCALAVSTAECQVRVTLFLMLLILTLG